MIGLKRGTVKLVPYNPEWESLFEKEKKRLQDAFGSTIISIKHIGSTAIPGIPAKPIIDINIGVESLEVARGMKEIFESLGYEHRPFVSGHTKEELKEQELYVKGGETRTHHVHVTVYGNNYWKRDLLICDYLRKHPERAEEYAELKERLAQQYPDNREQYTKNKKQFLDEICKVAKRESQSTRPRQVKETH